jgi:hypothetical protein
MAVVAILQQLALHQF